MAVNLKTHTLTQVSQDIANNSSVVRYLVQIQTTGNSHNDNNITTTYYIDGVRYTKTHKLPANSTTTVADKTVTIQHNADGTRSVSASFSTPTQISAGTMTGSKTLTLQTIPRASQITVNDANIGSSTNIVINKATDIFTTTLWYKTIGDNDWIQIVDKTPNQVYGWTVPTSFYSKIPNDKSLVCYFKADTYNGNTYIGTSTIIGATFTATGNPTINSISLVDENPTTIALTGDSSKMIRYASQVRATVNASAQNSASISSIFINNQQANNGVVDFYNSDTNNYQVVVNDSRGYQTYQTATMTMVDYVPLTLNATIKRNQPTDGIVNINFNGNYFNNSFGSQNNSLTVEYRYKESSSSTWGNWTSINATLSGNSYSGSTQLSNMDYTKSYNFEIRAYDKIQTKSITGITVTKGTPVYWWDNDQFDTNVRTNVNNDLAVSGAILATNGVNFLDGHNRFVYWKENSYGDKFGISPYFLGSGDDNKLRIMGAVGDYGTDPGMYDLMTISGASGNGWIKGNLDIDGNLRTSRSFLYTLNAGADFSGRHYKLINIPPDQAGEQAISVNIKGIIGDWVYEKGIIDIQISTRGGLNVYGTYYGNPNTFNEQRIVIFEESDGSHTVYLYCSGVYEGPSTLQITWGGVDYALPTIYTDYQYTYSPSGNIVWTSWGTNLNNIGRRDQGSVTTTKSAGNGNATSCYYWTRGNTVQLDFTFNSSGGSTSAGSSVWKGTLSGMPTPVAPVCGNNFKSGTAYLGYLETDGTLTVRVIAENDSQSSTQNTISFTYVID